jgi:CubicO group peptidase (beta-lactamase class C family)
LRSLKQGMEKPLLGWYGQVSASADSDPVDGDTAFMLASVSKPFIGAAIAALVDQGQIDLDDDICNVTGGEWLPNGEINWECRNPWFPETNVTWRMLITHRSSLNTNVPDVDNNTSAEYGPVGVNLGFDVVGNPSCPLEDTQQFFQDLFLNKTTETTVGNIGYTLNWFELAEDVMGGVWNYTHGPGEMNMYSNIATSYIASLIEKLTGETFDQFCKKNVFAKAGMNNTAWFRRDLPPNTVQAVPVYPYDEEIGTWEDVGHYCFITYASGGLYSTIRDLSAYAELMLSYGIGTLWSNNTAMEHAFGCQEKDELDKMLPDDSLECYNGLGWFHLSNATRDDLSSGALSDELILKELDWTNGIAHEGSDTGVATEFMILPAAKTYAIVLLNTEGADQNYFMKVVTMEGMALLNGDPPFGPDAYSDNDYDDAAMTTKAPITTNTTTNGNITMAPAAEPPGNIFAHNNGTVGLVEGANKPGPWNQTVAPGSSNATDPPKDNPASSKAVFGNGFQIATTGATMLASYFVALLCSLLLS